MTSPTLGPIHLSGEWTTQKLVERQREIAVIRWPRVGQVTLDATAITHFDTAGAWLFDETIAMLQQRGLNVHLQGMRGQHQNVLELVRLGKDGSSPVRCEAGEGRLARLGRWVWRHLDALCGLLGFIGETTLCLLRLAMTPWRIRWHTVATQIQTCGFNALPIVGLLAFLIGIVISYQGGIQLKSYGANIFIVELVTLTTVRELGPLLAAIVVAGRTGSAFTAQLASMQAADEIDSIRVMGLDPLELLVIPRLIGLLIALPLLALFSDIMAVFGGMVMSILLLDISLRDFVARLPEAVSLRSFLLGLVKAPIFALILGWVGCFHGLSAQKTAQSVGEHTTRSVVEGIFLVIVADAAFSVLFSALGI